MVKTLTLKNINKNIIKFTYQVRGPIVNKAYQILEELKTPNHNYPFKKIYMCNIGNPQELGQMPITFMRQMVAACVYPELIKNKSVPSDVIARSKRLLGSRMSIGAYTHSQGLPSVRNSVANYLTNRDNFKSNPENIFLSNGATQVIKMALQLLISSENDGIMVPIPQYPLYSASIQMFGGNFIGYYLDEGKNWAVDVKSMERSFLDATRRGIKPRAVCIINPGNPTGQVMTKQNILDIIRFANKNRLVILADEVYQHNIYDKSLPFHSFRKTLKELGDKFSNQELLSFDSASKGLFGECGIRGGYVEMLNIEQNVKDLFLKMASTSLCPNIIGQIAVEVLTNPPTENEESYDLFITECKRIYESLKRRADKISVRLSKIEGIDCRPVKGSMYAFPKITLPEKAIIAAKEKKLKPDAFYCLELLQTTGICTVPGSGFQQEHGTNHFRTTILPLEKEFDEVLENLEIFHKDFFAKYK